MIEINLSERDFDYEIQALVNSFFPGQRSVVVICGEERSEYEFADDVLLTVNISLSMKQIAVEVICGDYDLKKTEEVTGEKDWHKNKDKTTHPYRTYYKNVLPSPAVPHILQEEELPRKRWILYPLLSVW